MMETNQLWETIQKLEKLIKNPAAKISSQNKALLQEAADRLRLAFTMLLDSEAVQNKNAQLRQFCRFLAEENERLNKRLSEYEVVQKLKDEGRLDEIIKLTDHASNFILSQIKQERNKQ